MNLVELLPRDNSLISIKAGQPIFKEGEVSDVMYILFEGLVDISVGDKPIGTFEPIEILGEMAVITPAPRSATVIAKTDCKVAAINPGRFTALLQSKPEFALHILGMLVERMRWMDEQAKSHGAAEGETIANLKAQLEQWKATQQAQAAQLQELQSKLPVSGG